MAGDFLMRKDGFWHYVRRVPQALRDLDTRTFRRQTTGIRIADDPRGVKARRVAGTINDQVEAYWRGLLDGRSAEAKRRYDAARQRARALGWDYVEAAEMAEKRAAREIGGRLDTLDARNLIPDETAVAALLGGESPPQIMLSGLFGEFDALVRSSLTDYSPDQMRKWRTPRQRAAANLIAVVGDKPVTAVTRNDALDFREWWEKRVMAGDVEIGTANKDIGHLNSMFREIERRHRIGLGPVFGELRLGGEQFGSRTAYDPAFVQTRLLADGALAGLNPEARCILYMMIETGLRLSEAANLDEATIILDAEVPHVRIRPVGRRMKTPQSQRDIPLVGVSLMAAQAHPAGFPRYRDKAAGLSGTVNKYLMERGLRPTDGHSAYSLRHTFEDRLTAVEAPEKLIAALMGHKYARPKYGSGPSLGQKLEWLQRICLTPPSTV